LYQKLINKVLFTAMAAKVSLRGAMGFLRDFEGDIFTAMDAMVKQRIAMGFSLGLCDFAGLKNDSLTA
jgi:hypothetical protein